MSSHSQISLASVRSDRLLALMLFSTMAFAGQACAKRSPASSSTNDRQISASTSRRININTASAKELEMLPGIGEGLADRIVDHRKKYGPFRRTEHIMMVRGISDARFRAMRHLIKVE